MAKKPKSSLGTARLTGGGRKSVLLSLLIVILMTGAVVSCCLLIYMLSFVYGDVAVNLDSYKNRQEQTSIIYAMNEENRPYEIARLHGEENRIWVDLDDIPTDLRNAFICLEDKRFYKHGGVDWLRTIKAVLTLGRSGGGSTLTQQLIKNLTEERETTVSRKFNEILYALNLEKNYDKDEILEAYLNTIPLGSGCYGVQTASQKYFGRDVSTLNAAEAAVLAPITKAPTRYNPLLNPQNNRQRQKLCLKSMYKQGKLSEEDYRKWLNYNLVFTNSKDYVPDETAAKPVQSEEKIQNYYVDFVVDSVIRDLMATYGYTEHEAWKMVYYGGLKIYSCMDEKAQNEVDEVYTKRLSFPNEPGRTETGADGTRRKVQSAMTIMDYKGRVIALSGGAGEKLRNRGLNRAADSPRSPGSSVKPLSVYGPAVDRGLLNYSSMIQDFAIVVKGKRWPQNYGGSFGSPGHYVSLRTAIAQSLNTCSARTLQKLSVKTSMEYMLNRFHFSHLVTKGENTDANFSSLAVGGMHEGVTTLEMAAAYASFGNGGLYYEPYCYYKVTDNSGKNVYLENNPSPERALSAETAGILNRLMQSVVKPGGTAAGLDVKGFTTFLKTGTTSNDKDMWACGGTPYYVASVWIGYDRQEEMHGLALGAKIWSNVMNRIHKGLPEKDFTYPSSLVAREYCTSTGMLAGEGCPSKALGYYKLNKMPPTCTAHSGAEQEGDAEAKQEVASGEREAASSERTQGGERNAA